MLSPDVVRGSRSEVCVAVTNSEERRKRVQNFDR